MGRKRKKKPAAEGEGDHVEDEAHEDSVAPAACILVIESVPLVVVSVGSDFSVVDPRESALKFCTVGNPDAHTAPIRGMRLSGDGSVLVTGGDDKAIKAWRTKDWCLIRQCTMAKKVTAVAVTQDGAMAAGSDKFGDIFMMDVNGADPATLCLGHMSIITTMALSPDDQFLVTGDRDSSIRCSRFPDGFNIEEFCLGHKTYISQLLIKDDILFSADGTGELIVWRYKTGELLQRQELTHSVLAMGFSIRHDIFVLSLSNKSLVFFTFGQDQLQEVLRVPCEHITTSLHFDCAGTLWGASPALDAQSAPTTHVSVLVPACDGDKLSTPLSFQKAEDGNTNVHSAGQAVMKLMNANVASFVESAEILAGVQMKRGPKRTKTEDSE